MGRDVAPVPDAAAAAGGAAASGVDPGLPGLAPGLDRPPRLLLLPPVSSLLLLLLPPSSSSSRGRLARMTPLALWKNSLRLELPLKGRLLEAITAAPSSMADGALPALASSLILDRYLMHRTKDV